MSLITQCQNVSLSAKFLIESDPVLYIDRHRTCLMRAVTGGKAVRIDTEEAFGVIVRPQDFLISTASLQADQVFPPEPGHIVEHNKKRYRVTPVAGEPCWRFVEGTGDAYCRIHTQLESHC